MWLLLVVGACGVVDRLDAFTLGINHRRTGGEAFTANGLNMALDVTITAGVGRVIASGAGTRVVVVVVGVGGAVARALCVLGLSRANASL